MNFSFSLQSKLLLEVPEGSDQLMLCNIYPNHLFFCLNCNICNFTDDTTPYVYDQKFAQERLTDQSNIALKWFEKNFMKMSSDLCNLLTSDNKSEQVWTQIGEFKICKTGTVKLLGITIRNNLKFDEHLILCMKVNKKNYKRFNNRGYSLFFLMGIFLKHL